jgi:hypothetical protein
VVVRRNSQAELAKFPHSDNPGRDYRNMSLSQSGPKSHIQIKGPGWEAPTAVDADKTIDLSPRLKTQWTDG